MDPYTATVNLATAAIQLFTLRFQAMTPTQQQAEIQLQQDFFKWIQNLVPNPPKS